MSKLSWGVWAVRTAIAWVGGAAIAWGVSFWVADYVVKAHTTGTDSAISTINSTLSAINSTLGRIEGNLDRMDATLAGHTADLATIKATIGGEEGVPALALPLWLNQESFAQISFDASRARAISEDLTSKVDSLTTRVNAIEVSLDGFISGFKYPD